MRKTCDVNQVSPEGFDFRAASFEGSGHIGYASGSDNARETDDAIETDNARKSGNAKAPGSIPRGLLVRRFRLRLRTEL